VICRLVRGEHQEGRADEVGEPRAESAHHARGGTVPFCAASGAPPVDTPAPRADRSAHSTRWCRGAQELQGGTPRADQHVVGNPLAVQLSIRPSDT
ncbi:hypothetical protein T492DRAFT_902885, partial [Pavlovales sp. CCMP2436]